MRTSAVLAMALVSAYACVGAAPGSPPDASELMEADRAFAGAVARVGRDAWVSWFAEDGAQIQEGVGEVRGHEAIRELMAGLDDPGYSLTWEPLRADIADSGDLGWTTGTYRSAMTDADGNVRRGEGRYVTIWRRQSDGTWKVVMDLGNPTSAPEAG
ncbi:MAG: DUF4440 domain-containing protein [Gemmatimonadota bacterium]